MSDLTLAKLKKAVTAVANSTARRGEAIRTLAKHIDDEARDTARIAEGIGAMGVDKETVSETSDLSKIMAGLSEQSLVYASASADTSRRAQAAHDQAHASHGGMQEAFKRSPVDLSTVKREWFRQE